MKGNSVFGGVTIKQVCFHPFGILKYNILV
jgi:hypothetical protein